MSEPHSDSIFTREHRYTNMGSEFVRRAAVVLLLAWLASGFVVACNDDDDDENGGNQIASQFFADWLEINPALSQYEALHEDWVPGMGIHWGVPGPHVTVGIGHEDQVTLVELIVPAAAGWQPWFDQDENEPMMLDGVGEVYTQHIYLVERDTISEGSPAEPLEMTFEALEAENPALGMYIQLSPWVPQMGYHWGMEGPCIVVLVGEEGEIYGFEIISPAAQGWFPWFDQPENEPMDLGGNDVYTQHVYIVPPHTID